MKIIHPPNDLLFTEGPTVFLAGSIEMGAAWNWQEYVVTRLTEMYEIDNVVFFNPRRPDWDSSWEQTTENKNFVEQVNWELDALENADFIIMYFDPNTKSPISLLELGKFADFKDNFFVACPEGFWRRGNVEIFCNRYGVTFADSLDATIRALAEELYEV